MDLFLVSLGKCCISYCLKILKISMLNINAD